MWRSIFSRKVARLQFSHKYIFCEKTEKLLVTLTFFGKQKKEKFAVHIMSAHAQWLLLSVLFGSTENFLKEKLGIKIFPETWKLYLSVSYTNKNVSQPEEGHLS